MRNKIMPLLLLVVIGSLTPQANAQGDLMVMPKRLVFDGSQRSQEINLANTGSDTAVYAISFLNYKMTEQGNFEEIQTPEEGQRFANNYLRYFPRRVTLAPNEAQTIRVQLTRSGNLEHGEYRSHMYFRAVEKPTALGADSENTPEGIAIQIKTIFGISIPIIIRQGQNNVEVSLSNVQFTYDKNDPELSIDINRHGDFSVYGNLLVEHTAPSGEKTEVGTVKGISVYTPNSKRQFLMKLAMDKHINFDVGKLKITFSTDKSGELATYVLEL